MKPLDDLLVLDLSRVLSGPFCTMGLSDMGARVIKVEHPEGGDDTRGFGPPFINGESTYFLSINRGKESLTLDLKHPRGREVLWRLVEKADVLIENFRPGVLDRLGFSFEACSARNPRLVFCSISGFGHEGLPEWSQKAGYDLVIQGMGGIQGVTGFKEGPPTKVGPSIADLVSGMMATQGILLALITRQRTGKGQKVDISMLDGQVNLLTYLGGIYFAEGRIPGRMGNAHTSIAPYETYRTADGHLNLAVGNDSLWQAFCIAANRHDLAGDARFTTNRDRVAHRAELSAELEPLLLSHPVSWWTRALDKAGVPCGPIQDVGQVLEHPQVKARDMVVELQHPTAGSIKVTGVPIRLSMTPGKVEGPPPLLGQHTDAVLGTLLGLSDDDIEGLRRDGVI